MLDINLNKEITRTALSIIKISMGVLFICAGLWWYSLVLFSDLHGFSPWTDTKTCALFAGILLLGAYIVRTELKSKRIKR